MRKLPKLDLNITNRCNLHCKHCAFDSGTIEMKEMSLDKLTGVLYQTKELGGEKIEITGGEPTLRGDYLAVLQIAKSLGFKVELVTNSLLLNKDLLIELQNEGLDSIAISMDGYQWKTHANIRGITEKQFYRVMENVANAVDLGIKTKINTTVFESNLGEILDIVKGAKFANVDELGLYYFTPIGRGSRYGEKSVEPLKWLDFVRNELFHYKDLLKVSLETPLIEKELYKEEMGCIWSTDPYHLQILPDGNVYPCAIMASYQMPAGNLYRNTVGDVWNDKQLWLQYQRKLSSLFTCNGSCVDFSEFNIKDYQDHEFVCPLKKFSVDDLMVDRKSYCSELFSGKIEKVPEHDSSLLI